MNSRLKRISKRIQELPVFTPLSNSKAIIYIILLGFIVYCNSLFNGFVGDDFNQLVSNPIVHSLQNIPQIFSGSTFYSGTNILTGQYYRPIMSLSYTILYVFFGDNAFPFHLFQLILHISSTIVLFFIFSRFFKRGLALLLSLLFLVHTMNSETVSYISGLTDVLFFFFGICALYCEITLRRSITKQLLISILLFLSLLSKESGVLFIAIILLYKFLFDKKDIGKIFVFFIGIFALYGYFRLFIDHATYTQAILSAPITQLSLLTRSITVPAVILYYIKTAFLPIHLSFVHQWIIKSISSTGFIIPLCIDIIVIIAMITFGIFLHKKHKKHVYPYFFFSFWLWIGLLMYSQLFFVLDFTVSDRWFYFPLVGLLGIIGVLVQLYLQKPKRNVVPVYLLFVCTITVLSILTFNRNANFHDNLSIGLHDIQYAPESSALAYGLGYQYLHQGNLVKAKPYLMRAAKLDPKEGINWYSLALLYDQEGETTYAQKYYRKTLQISDYSPAYENLSLFLLIHGNYQKALQIADIGVGKFPKDGRIWMVKSLIEYKLGNENEAILSSKKAYSYSSSNLTYIISILLMRHLQFNIYSKWTNQGRIIGVLQS